MFYRLSRPLESIYLVAILTIDRKPGILVVGIGRIRKITAVTIDTCIADSVEFQARFRYVAGIAIGCGMCAQKREPVIGMEFGDVVHQPAVGGMAAPAIIANGIAMYIGMTGNTGRVRF